MLNLQAPINSFGYGIAGYNIAYGLSERLDNNYNLFPIGNVIVGSDLKSDFLKRKKLEYYSDHPTVKIYHQDQLFDHVGTGEYFGFPFFELNTFSKQEQLSLSYCNEIITCSKWGKTILEEHDFDNVSVVPLGVDRNIFNENRAHTKSKSKTIFINIGKLEKRKGHDILPEAFLAAFKNKKDHELWMVIDNPFYPDWVSSYKLRVKKLLGDQVKFIPYCKTQTELASIINMADFGVFPARAEGWNLDLLECLSCGLPCIATNYSGHTEYVGVDNCELLSVESLIPAHDSGPIPQDYWFRGQGDWADINFDELVCKLQLLSSKKGTLNENGIKTAKAFSWENTVDELLKVIGYC